MDKIIARVWAWCGEKDGIGRSAQRLQPQYHRVTALLILLILK
jgi:hypothetical protein